MRDVALGLVGLVVLVLAGCSHTFTEWTYYTDQQGKAHHIRKELDIDGTPRPFNGAYFGEPESWSVVEERVYRDNVLQFTKMCDRGSEPSERICHYLPATNEGGAPSRYR
jgi:hypothetical protein